MKTDLAMMYGREGEAIARYHLQRNGGQWTMPDDCDLCKCKLQSVEQAPQTLHWRTKPERVSTEHKLLVTVKGWAQHRQRASHLYPNTPEFIHAVTALLQSGKPKPGTQEAVDLLANETSGKRLVRMQGSGDPVQLEVKVGRLASNTHSSAWEVVQAVENTGFILKQLGTPIALPVVLDAMGQENVKSPSRNLPQLTEAVQSQLVTHR